MTEDAIREAEELILRTRRWVEEITLKKRFLLAVVFEMYVVYFK